MTTDLPPLFACEFCGSPVDPNAPGTWRRVTGWVEVRKSGTGPITHPESPHGWACRGCMLERKTGINRGQGGLF
jgi:hypothetical protein